MKRKSLRQRVAEREVWNFKGEFADSPKELFEEVSAREGVTEVQLFEEKQAIIYKVGEEVFGGLFSEVEPDMFCIYVLFKVFGNDLEKSIDDARELYQKMWV